MAENGKSKRTIGRKELTMWKPPWRYFEGWCICIGLLITGLMLQFSFGKVEPELFRFPVNLMTGAGFLLFLLMFHIGSRRIKSLQWFSGHTAGITSFASLLFLMILMGLTRQLPSSLDVSHESAFVRMGWMQMTVSWQFLLLSFYFLFVLGWVILRRLRRFRWKDAGFILNHAGLFIALFAAILGSADVQKLRMSVPLNEPEWRATNEKNEMVELPLAIELKSFTIDEYPPKLLLVDNLAGIPFPETKPEHVSVDDCPLVARLVDWELEIVRYLPYAAVIINRDTINCVEFHAEGASSAIYVKARNLSNNAQNEGWISCGNYMFPYASLRLNEQLSLVMANPEPRRYASDVTVYAKNGETKDAMIEVNKPLSIAGWKIYQSGYDVVSGKWSRYSVFELVKDPWSPVVGLGIVMLLAGSIFLFVSTPKKTD